MRTSCGPTSRLEKVKGSNGEPAAIAAYPRVANMVSIIEGIRVNKQFDAGGSTSTSMPVQPAAANTTSTAETERLASAYEMNTAVMLRMIQKLDEPQDARINWDHLTNTTAEIQATQQSAGIGK